jgi:hypothetical protein
MRSDVCLACFYMRAKCVITVTWCTRHQVICGCACTRVYVHAQSNWILYEIRFKVSTTFAHLSYLLLIASDILLRKSVWYLRSMWRRRTWILAPSLIWVAVRSGDDRQVRHRLLQRHHFSWDMIPPIAWPMTLSPTTEAIRVKSCEKKPLV